MTYFHYKDVLLYKLYKAMDHNCNEGIREELEITDINIMMINYIKKWLEELEIIHKIRSSSCSSI
jgi:hypothetical protein